MHNHGHSTPSLHQSKSKSPSDDVYTLSSSISSIKIFCLDHSFVKAVKTTNRAFLIPYFSSQFYFNRLYDVNRKRGNPHWHEAAGALERQRRYDGKIRWKHRVLSYVSSGSRPLLKPIPLRYERIEVGHKCCVLFKLHGAALFNRMKGRNLIWSIYPYTIAFCVSCFHVFLRTHLLTNLIVICALHSADSFRWKFK